MFIISVGCLWDDVKCDFAIVFMLKIDTFVMNVLILFVPGWDHMTNYCA